LPADHVTEALSAIAELLEVSGPFTPEADATRARLRAAVDALQQPPASPPPPPVA